MKMVSEAVSASTALSSIRRRVLASCARNALGWLTQTQKAVGPARKRLGRAEVGSPTLEHEHVGPRPFSKDTIRAIRLNWYHREFAAGSGKGTIRTPDGQLVQGLHVAAWSWELWRRIDEATARLHAVRERTGWPSRTA